MALKPLIKKVPGLRQCRPRVHGVVVWLPWGVVVHVVLAVVRPKQLRHRLGRVWPLPHRVPLLQHVGGVPHAVPKHPVPRRAALLDVLVLLVPILERPARLLVVVRHLLVSLLATLLRLLLLPFGAYAVDLRLGLKVTALVLMTDPLWLVRLAVGRRILLRAAATETPVTCQQLARVPNVLVVRRLGVPIRVLLARVWKRH